MTLQFPILSLSMLWLIACASSSSLPANEQTASAHSTATNPSARSYFELGQSYDLAGDSIRAEEYLSLAVDLGYPPEQALPALLRVCLQAGRLRAALGHAEPILKEHPADSRLRQLVAAIHLGLGDPTRASDELEAVLIQAPELAEVHYLLATIYRTDLADDRAATLHYRSYLRLEPQGAHSTEAQNWLNQPRHEEAPRREGVTLR